MLTAAAHPAPAPCLASGAGCSAAPAGAAGAGGATPAPGPRLARWASRPTAACVPLLRARVRAALAEWGVSGELADTLLLAVAELAGNAVRHAAPATDRLRVTLAVGAGRLWLEVEDGDPTPPAIPGPRTASAPCADAAAGPGFEPAFESGFEPPAGAALAVDPEAEGGRGLLIVGLLVAEARGRLSVRSHRSGKTVRVCVPTT
ncbi:ATP-binding protein [Streptomyces sp. NPDC101118]|uniref:ATP-binding protein n=1 Tax=Streptomyces sp. NPDC101118 TaxID=3366109 RepID=UPI0037FFC053